MATSVGFQLEGGRIPGERINTNEITTNSTTFTTTETEIATVDAEVVSGRTYKVVADLGFDITASGVVRLRVKEDNSSGAIIGTRDYYCDSGGSVDHAYFEAEYTADATETKTFSINGDVLSGGGTANINANSSARSYVYVEYVRD